MVCERGNIRWLPYNLIRFPPMMMMRSYITKTNRKIKQLLHGRFIPVHLRTRSVRIYYTHWKRTIVSNKTCRIIAPIIMIPDIYLFFSHPKTYLQSRIIDFFKTRHALTLRTGHVRYNTAT